MNHPPTHLTFMPHVNGLRAIAVLSVILYHLNPLWLPGGFLGVDIFFVISGFIVSASAGSLDRLGLLKFMGVFYARRFQRIAPALVVCLLVTCVATTLLVPSAWLSEANQRTARAAFFGLSNFVLAKTSNDYFSPVTDFNSYTHTWSLGVEEQFYFIFPFLFFAWNFHAKGRRWSVGLFVAGLIASAALSAWMTQSNKTLAFYMLASRFWELAAGVVLFQAMTLFGRRFDTALQPSPKWFALGAAGSLVLIGYGFAVVPNANAFPFPGALPSVIGALGLLGFMHGMQRHHPLMQLLANSPAQFIGKISYSLYLWHWPVFVLFRWTVGIDSPDQRLAALAMAFALATASYYWVEAPLRRHPALRYKPSYAIVAIGLLAISVSGWIAGKIDRERATISLSSVTRNARDWYPHAVHTDRDSPGCKVQTTNTALGPDHFLSYFRKDCSPPATAARMFVIGDSHALAYEPMFKGYTLETGVPVTVFNNGGCPFISLQPWREESPACQASAKRTTDSVLSILRPGDIVFLTSLRMPRFVDQWFRLPELQAEDELFSTRAIQARAQAMLAAEPILRAFHAKGAHIVFEAPKPIFRSPIFRCAESYNRSNPICRDGTDMSRIELERMRKPVVDALRQLAGSIDGVSVWDPFPVLCPPAIQCSAFSNGHPLFFDGDHISGYGNRLLLPSFRASTDLIGVVRTEHSRLP